MGRKYAAVAYIGIDGSALLSDFGAGDILVCNAGDNALRSGVTHPSALKTLIDRGVEVFSNNRLHAKVYVVGDTAIIGSANASSNAAIYLEEAVVKTADRTIAAEARQFIKKMGRGGTAVDENYIKYAQTVYRAPRGGTERSERPAQSTRSNLRLFVASFQAEDAPKAVETHYQAHRHERQSQAGLAARWTVDISWDRDPRWIRRDDWVLWICENAEPNFVLPPMKVLKRDTVARSKQILTWFQAPAKKETLSLEHVSSRLMARAGHKLKAETRVNSADAVAALFSLWRFSPDEGI